MTVGLVSSAHVLRYRHVVRWTSEKIRERRDDLGMTQEQLAERVGASLRTVWGWEDGATPQKKWTEKLDEVLGEPRAGVRAVPLEDKGAAQLVAEIAERLTELARRADRNKDPQPSRVPPPTARRTDDAGEDAARIQAELEADGSFDLRKRS